MDKKPVISKKQTEELRRVLIETREKLKTDPEFRESTQEIADFVDRHSFGNDTRD